MRGDERYMGRALELARRGIGSTNPNPPVGAVIVKGGRIIGEGYHRRCGGPHAEVYALREAGRRSRGATLYVTLEPCDHIGRTGACTRAIIDAGIARVVIGAPDPNPITRGRGMRRLRSGRISTDVGVLRDQAAALIKPFAKYIRRGVPYVTIKMAQSLDGKIATRTGHSRWISSGASRRLVHALRGKVDGIMVGVNTVLRDDPRLLARAVAGHQPSRIIVDSALRTPAAARVLRTAKVAPVYIATTRRACPRKAKILEAKGARILYLVSERGKVALDALLSALAELDMMHLLVEGGGGLVAGLLQKRLADELVLFVAPKIIGGAGAPTSVEGSGVALIDDAIPVKGLSFDRSGPDIVIRGNL